jgi:hypothetical protein
MICLSDAAARGRWSGESPRLQANMLSSILHWVWDFKCRINGVTAKTGPQPNVTKKPNYDSTKNEIL